MLGAAALFALTDLHHVVLQSLCANNSKFAEWLDIGLEHSMWTEFLNEKRVDCRPIIEKIECLG